MRDFGHVVIREYPSPSFLQYLRATMALGFAAGIIFGSLEFIYETMLFKRISLGKMIIIGMSSYLLCILLFVSFGVKVFSRILGIELDWQFYQNFIFSKEMILLTIYCFIVGFFIDLFKQVDRKFGPGNLLKMLKGEFYHPKEDERIFMFLDLRSSTAIAEQLGHLQYSSLIQDCFLDLEVVEKYHAEIYQYVGDEAVLTWKKQIGLDDSNCLRAFFEFKQKLHDKSDYYNKKYGLVPEFKAGLNVGKITIAEVGQIKTEIAYHGDTINTAARIQDQCNNLGKTLLISEELRNSLIEINEFSSVHVGDLLLKGKSQKVNIYSVEVV